MQYTFDADFRSVCRRLAEASKCQGQAETQNSSVDGRNREPQETPGLRRSPEREDPVNFNVQKQIACTDRAGKGNGISLCT